MTPASPRLLVCTSSVTVTKPLELIHRHAMTVSRHPLGPTEADRHVRLSLAAWRVGTADEEPSVN